MKEVKILRRLKDSTTEKEVNKFCRNVILYIGLGRPLSRSGRLGEEINHLFMSHVEGQLRIFCNIALHT
jgi:hypothetical protein